ncbi:hypothetical protein BT63DRAFT_37450 [Microthyrium microscopicum]|uniref:Uncharacterized protein n=1 Tax=Microthyrium microscopicum TaxID=703497 RepID=A0A6A6UT50_9PEZI|nr:hypothetical protein BT63DRAFT_37450 [Microthyrium microscopicum]
MAPLRNRAVRHQNDTDHMMEGLPVRNWRRVESTIAEPPEEQVVTTTMRWPELAMPRDSHLLSDVSRQLLRIARYPKVLKVRSAHDDEDKEHVDEENGHANGQGLPGANNHKRKHEEIKGFTVKKWSQMPKEYSAPDPEYLAKRRKGLPVEGQVLPFNPQGQPNVFRNVKVKRFEPDGTSHVYEVMAPVGQPVEGEIVEDKSAVIETDPTPAPGTIISGVGVVNDQGIIVSQPVPQQNKRKPPPPPRKKKKGPFGRHGKKIATELGPDGLPVHPPGPSDALTPGGSEDTPMGEADDDDDDDESGEDGEDHEEHEGNEDHEDGELSASATPTTVPSSLPRDSSIELPSTQDLANPNHGLSSLRSEIRLEPEASNSLADSTIAPLPTNADSNVQAEEAAVYEQGNQPMNLDSGETPGYAIAKTLTDTTMLESHSLLQDPLSSSMANANIPASIIENPIALPPVSTFDPIPMELDASSNAFEPSLQQPVLIAQPSIVEATTPVTNESMPQPATEIIAESIPPIVTESAPTFLPPVMEPVVETVTNPILEQAIEPVVALLAESIAEPVIPAPQPVTEEVPTALKSALESHQPAAPDTTSEVIIEIAPTSSTPPELEPVCSELPESSTDPTVQPNAPAVEISAEPSIPASEPTASNSEGTAKQDEPEDPSPAVETAEPASST